jgi:hypothetical protein
MAGDGLSLAGDGVACLICGGIHNGVALVVAFQPTIK